MKVSAFKWGKLRMHEAKLFTEIANLLTIASMIGHDDHPGLKRTLIRALAADTGMSSRDVDALLHLAEANQLAGRAVPRTETVAHADNVIALSSEICGHGIFGCRTCESPFHS